MPSISNLFSNDPTYTVYDSQDGSTYRSGLTREEAEAQLEDFNRGRVRLDRYEVVTDAEFAQMLATASE
jgi:hypothetical protein